MPSILTSDRAMTIYFLVACALSGPVAITIIRARS